MAFQKIFKQEYCNLLAEQAKNGIGLERYAMDEFPIEENQTLFAARVIQPEGLVERMPVDDDFAAAVALYEEYSNLSPLQATDQSFWIYLAHVDLFKYVQNRFDEVKHPETLKPEYVPVHWFFRREFVRNALAGLWWNVKTTVIDDPNDKYKYTKFLFSQYDFRMISFANYIMFRNENQRFGMLDFFMDHPEVCNQDRSREYFRHFNRLGGNKQLIGLPKEFFYEEMERLLPKVLTI